MSRQIAVIGMGAVGVSVACTLADQGYEVLGIDCDRDRIQDLVDELPSYVQLVTADATEPGVLRDLSLDEFDGVSVTIGDAVQANILATMNLVELGCTHISARATSDLHARVLERVGAHHVLDPAQQAGKTLARLTASQFVVDYLELDGGESLVESEVPTDWVGRPLAELDLDAAGITVLVHKQGDSRGVLPHGETVFGASDRIVVGGTDEALRKSALFLTPGR